MKIQILVDNRNSWIIPYAEKLCTELSELGYSSLLIYDHDDVTEGDILCLLGCEKIFSRLDLNKNNLVVHESDLPKGKGWSPLTWQILVGENKIPVTLFEAVKGVDAGDIYLQKHIKLSGKELLQEIKHLQGLITIDLILSFIKEYPNNKKSKQKGKSSFYKRRTLEDSELDIDKSIREQFNLLRVCDNERYPAFFIIDGNKFILKTYKEPNDPSLKARK